MFFFCVAVGGHSGLGSQPLLMNGAGCSYIKHCSLNTIYLTATSVIEPNLFNFQSRF